MAARRLKVFQAQFGFFDTVIAAPSQAAALKAWGVRQNLFASGDAKPATDEAAIQAALAQPETPLRRAVGTNAPFQLKPTSLPKAPEAPKRPSVHAKTAAKAPPPAKPPPDRGKLDAAEAALRKVDEDRRTEEATLRKRQEDLEAAKSAAQRSYVEARQLAIKAIDLARHAYREDGSEV